MGTDGIVRRVQGDVPPAIAREPARSNARRASSGSPFSVRGVRLGGDRFAGIDHSTRAGEPTRDRRHDLWDEIDTVGIPARGRKQKRTLAEIAARTRATDDTTGAIRRHAACRFS